MDFLFSFALFELVEETLEAHHREGDFVLVRVSPLFHRLDLCLDVGGRHGGKERGKDPLRSKLSQDQFELLLVFFSR